MPPSGHLAGLWSRNDDERGVHKAPANEVIRGALGLELVMTKGENDLLNPLVRKQSTTHGRPGVVAYHLYAC